MKVSSLIATYLVATSPDQVLGWPWHQACRQQRLAEGVALGSSRLPRPVDTLVSCGVPAMPASGCADCRGSAGAAKIPSVGVEARSRDSGRRTVLGSRKKVGWFTNLTTVAAVEIAIRRVAGPDGECPPKGHPFPILHGLVLSIGSGSMKGISETEIGADLMDVLSASPTLAGTGRRLLVERSDRFFSRGRGAIAAVDWNSRLECRSLSQPAELLSTNSARMGEHARWSSGAPAHEVPTSAVDCAGLVNGNGVAAPAGEEL